MNQRFRDAIAKKLDQPVAEWEQLTGGQTNRTWRVRVGGQTLVVKLFSNELGNPLFPNRPADEVTVLRHLEPLKIAPRLHRHFKTEWGDVVVYDLQPGHSWTGNLQAAADVLRKLHQQPVLSGLRQLPGGSQQIDRQSQAILAKVPDHQQQELLRLRPATPVADASETRLIHGDPVAGNLIECDDRCILIDWQCPANGDPVEDLALFLSPAMQLLYRGQPLSKPDVAAFLTVYGNEHRRKRLGAMAPWYHWRMLCYCAWRMAQGSAKHKAAFSLEMKALEDA